MVADIELIATPEELEITLQSIAQLSIDIENARQSLRTAISKKSPKVQDLSDSLDAMRAELVETESLAAAIEAALERQ